MTSRLLCGSERARGLTGPWWNVKKEGQSRAQKTDIMIQVLRVRRSFDRAAKTAAEFILSLPKGSG